jgi:hypothetical protein
MSGQRTNHRTSRGQVGRQQSLLASNQYSAVEVTGPAVSCDVVAIEKRRDGGTRFWCRAHRADATAKYGKPASKCRAADSIPIHFQAKILDLDRYLGGVALWGAAPAVYDTTKLPMERGIHVHARPTPKSEKEIDLTFEAVQIVGKGLPGEGIVVNQIDAIYHLVSSVFGFTTRFVTCTHCGWPHLDKDYFSVHPHRRHLCAGCGKHFHDRARGIGNPIVAVRDACGTAEHRLVQAPENLTIKQSEYPGGIQIWGSNPAFLWTQPKPEEEGIHVHAFVTDSQEEPTVDDTFAHVVIDGVRLDPVMVRMLMAQKVLPLLNDRVRSANCPDCGHPQFDTGEAAYTPLPIHTCSECRREFAIPGRTRNTVINPLPAILAELAKQAPRPPQQDRLDLLPETL